MNQDLKISVLVVDDHQVDREGIITFLNTANDIEVIGQAANFPETVRKAKELTPNVILLNNRLPGTKELEACRILAHESTEMRVIILTNFVKDDYPLGALCAGAYGCLLKTASRDEIVDCIRAVAKGERQLSAPLIDMLITQFSELAREVKRRETGLDFENIY
jgi:DNA-binding NarL/FixJ family response regulator